MMTEEKLHSLSDEMMEKYTEEYFKRRNHQDVSLDE